MLLRFYSRACRLISCRHLGVRIKFIPFNRLMHRMIASYSFRTTRAASTPAIDTVHPSRNGFEYVGKGINWRAAAIRLKVIIDF